TRRPLQLRLQEKARERFLVKEQRQERRSCCVNDLQKKKLTFGPETKSFIEGLIQTSVTSLGDMLSSRMANMERMFAENMGKMEIEVSQLRDAISLTAPPKSKANQDPPKSKGAQAPPKRKGDQPTPTKKFLTHMNTSRRHSYGVPSRCWCGKGVVIFCLRTDDNPYRRFYRCEIGAQWVDDALLDDIRRVEAEQGRIIEEIEDLKSSITQTIEEEVRKQKNSLELGCLGSVLWVFGRLRSQE
ncbi:hypothetical protein HID58_075013, partial [Brassica napus]